MSAVNALATAASAGQKIYTITASVYKANPYIVSAKLGAHSASTRDTVQQALDAGYEVTIHEAPITQDGWTGAGFTMTDSATGAGGYIIEGGSSGGSLLVQGGLALLSLITLVNGLNILQKIFQVVLVGAKVNPYVRLFVATITLIAVLVSENPYETTAATQPLALIGLFAHLGALFAFPGAGILFALVFSIPLIYVALLVQDLIFAGSKDEKRSIWRYA